MYIHESIQSNESDNDNDNELLHSFDEFANVIEKLPQCHSPLATRHSPLATRCPLLVASCSLLFVICLHWTHFIRCYIYLYIYSCSQSTCAIVGNIVNFLGLSKFSRVLCQLGTSITNQSNVSSLSYSYCIWLAEITMERSQLIHNKSNNCSLPVQMFALS